METIKGTLYKLRLRSSGKILTNLSNLEVWQWLNKKQISTLQQEHLTKLIHYAYENVPYYQEILPIKDLMDSNGLVNMNTFSTIPFLTKDIIRNRFEQLKSKRLNQLEWYKNTSGGSTGEPVILVQHKEVKEWEQSIKILYDTWTGKQLGDKQIRLWGSERDILVGNETLRTEFGKWMRNEIYLNAFSMSDEKVMNYVEVVNSFQPVQILAYPESIFEIAKFIEEKRLKVYSPRSIMTTAGTLFPFTREVIERVFKAPVFNRYGSREVGDIACECEYHQGLHISAPIHYVELIKEDGTSAGPGEEGEIVLTSLMNYGMPLIRYKIGDRGIWSEADCPCGRGWPLLKEVTGRVTDTFITNDKKHVSGFYFVMRLFFREWIRNYQVIQEDYNFIKILIVLKDLNIKDPYRFYQSEIENITNDYQLVMGKDCKIYFEFVTKIESSSSGKYRYIMSKVPRK